MTGWRAANRLYFDLTARGRTVRSQGPPSQLAATGKRIESNPQYAALAKAGEALTAALAEIEEALYQTKMESRQDPLNYPIRLNDKLAGVMALVAVGNNPPSESLRAVRDELVATIDLQLAKLARLIADDLVAFNDLAAKMNLPAIAPKAEPNARQATE